MNLEKHGRVVSPKHENNVHCDPRRDKPKATDIYYYLSSFFFLLSLDTFFSILLFTSPHSLASLTSIHSLFCHLVRFEVNFSVCLCGRGGVRDKPDPDSPFYRYLIKTSVGANHNYQRLHAAPPRLCQHGCLYAYSTAGRRLHECAAMSVLIVLGGIRLASAGPQRPVCHIQHCPLNTDDSLLVCISNHQMFTDPCFANADDNMLHRSTIQASCDIL